MKKIKPQQFLDELYPCVGYTTKTVINWIKSGRIKGEQTPSGRWLVLVDDKPKSNISTLVKILEAADD